MANTRPTPPTIQQVDSRLAKIEQELKPLVLEKEKLTAYRHALVNLTEAEHVRPASMQSPKTPTANGNGNRVGVAYTLDYARKILKAKGAAIHLDEMVKIARKQGWNGSGDDEKDRERFYSTMHRHPNEFTKTATLTWGFKTP